MGRMKEIFMEMCEREIENMSVAEFLAMRRTELLAQQPHPDPESELGDEYWAEKAVLQEQFEKEMEEEMKKEAELPSNKKIPPCVGHDFQEE